MSGDEQVEYLPLAAIRSYIGKTVLVAGRNFSIRGFLALKPDGCPTDMPTYEVRTIAASANFFQECIDCVEQSNTGEESIVITLRFFHKSHYHRVGIDRGVYEMND